MTFQTNTNPIWHVLVWRLAMKGIIAQCEPASVVERFSSRSSRGRGGVHAGATSR